MNPLVPICYPLLTTKEIFSFSFGKALLTTIEAFKHKYEIQNKRSIK